MVCFTERVDEICMPDAGLLPFEWVIGTDTVTFGGATVQCHTVDASSALVFVCLMLLLALRLGALAPLLSVVH